MTQGENVVLFNSLHNVITHLKEVLDIKACLEWIIANPNLSDGQKFMLASDLVLESDDEKVQQRFICFIFHTWAGKYVLSDYYKTQLRDFYRGSPSFSGDIELLASKMVKNFFDLLNNS